VAVRSRPSIQEPDIVEAEGGPLVVVPSDEQIDEVVAEEDGDFSAPEASGEDEGVERHTGMSPDALAGPDGEPHTGMGPADTEAAEAANPPNDAGPQPDDDENTTELDLGVGFGPEGEP
jgi:hypothetical protein